MAEQHRMEVRWSGANEVVTMLVEAAQRHGCETTVEQDGDNASLCASFGRHRFADASRSGRCFTG